MIPKIEFVYSRVYDNMFYESLKKPMSKKLIGKYPSLRTLKNYRDKIKVFWREDEKRILGSISRIAGLKWKRSLIIVYIVGNCRPFSDPLTMKVYKNKNDFIDTLTHELIHQIQIQNLKLYAKWQKMVLSIKYKQESPLTKSHILLHSLHKTILLEHYGKKRLNRQLRKDKHYEDYRRAWEIVEKEGAENIIKKFKEVIRK